MRPSHNIYFPISGSAEEPLKDTHSLSAMLRAAFQKPTNAHTATRKPVRSSPFTTHLVEKNLLLSLCQ